MDYHPKMTLAACKKVISQYEVLVINSKIIADREFLNQGKKLEVIARLGSGLEIIDLDFANEQGILVVNSS